MSKSSPPTCLTHSMWCTSSTQGECDVRIQNEEIIVRVVVALSVMFEVLVIFSGIGHKSGHDGVHQSICKNSCNHSVSSGCCVYITSVRSNH